MSLIGILWLTSKAQNLMNSTISLFANHNFIVNLTRKNIFSFKKNDNKKISLEFEIVEIKMHFVSFFAVLLFRMKFCEYNSVGL